MKCIPKEPIWFSTAACTRGIPLSFPSISTPDNRIMKAEVVHIKSVSIHTDTICTKPCFTGWETSAVAAAFDSYK